MSITNFSRLRFTFCILYFTFLIFISSCSIQKQISKSAKENVLSAPALQTAHVGISIYEPATNKYWYDYQGDHYFVPASNTKIPTCYAAMKYLGDSLVGLRYGYSKKPYATLLVIQPTGDPTLLYPDFKNQPVWDFFSKSSEQYKEDIAILDTIWRDDNWGSGWTWNDYDADYMAERSTMPIYGNVIDIKLNEVSKRNINDTIFIDRNKISLFKTQNRVFDTMVNSEANELGLETVMANQPMVEIKRDLSNNIFWIEEGNRKFRNTAIPFVTKNPLWPWNSSHYMTEEIIADAFKFKFGNILTRNDDTSYSCPNCRNHYAVIKNWNIIHSQPTDSLLKPMMHRSDNFFAEQSLLMVSNERLGIMNDAKIIDTLLKTDFKDLPQKPRWVDGSGLSRYNLFSPQDLVTILNKMKNEFGMERVKVILPTGGEGTISSYYKTESGYIFVKTGTLSGVVALSGFLYTKKNKLLIFSVLVNNHNASATDVRRAVEKFLQGIRNKY